MSKFRRISSLGIVVVLSVSVLFNCTKEVGEDELVERNGLMYEKNSDDPFSGKSIAYFGNGQKYISVTYTEGKADGLVEEWYENGQIQSRWNIKNGKEQGAYKEWHDNGQIEETVEYRDGKMHGTRKRWHKDGQVRSKDKYRDGKKL